jgi:hypothetical protein
MNPEVILPAMLREERARNLAPELVEALREALFWDGEDDHGVPAVWAGKARDLLAKIDGEQP